MVGAGRLELPASTSQMSRATNCATPHYTHTQKENQSCVVSKVITDKTPATKSVCAWYNPLGLPIYNIRRFTGKSCAVVWLARMAGTVGLEPTTFGLTGQRILPIELRSNIFPKANNLGRFCEHLRTSLHSMIHIL